jgi:hypothetical protein
VAKTDSAITGRRSTKDILADLAHAIGPASAGVSWGSPPRRGTPSHGRAKAREESRSDRGQRRVAAGQGFDADTMP